ncbi:MAG: TMEM165/GDT1 family protein [Methanotrichaceae archaeon]|nr:TMEM165/GDT1 family protein [Methanotrichaceae archaeon]
MIDPGILQGVFIPFLAIALAEMGDKTQLSVLLLSSRTHEYLKLLAGVMLAFLIVDGVAILLGYWVTAFVPMSLLKLISAAVFIGFGVLILIRNAEEAEEVSFKSPFISGFSLIFVSEWGDKTQIASALFAAEYGAGQVLAGTMLALLLLSILAIYLGRLISERVDRRLITRVAGVVFIIIGVSFALSLLNFSAFAEML